MSMSTHQHLVDEVEYAAERLEDVNTYEDMVAVDYQATVGSDGSVKEVTVMLSTGGPRVEVELYSGLVTGYSGSETCKRFVNTVALANIADYLAQNLKTKMR